MRERKSMDQDERVKIIREANALYNAGNIEGAKALYLRTNYSAGLIRIADHYYEQRKPILAMLLYRKAGCRERVEELYEHAAAVIRMLLNEDTEPQPLSRHGEDPVE